MDLADFLDALIAAEMLLLISVGVYLLVADSRQRAAYRRLVMHTFTQHPIANTRPPTGLADARGLLDDHLQI